MSVPVPSRMWAEGGAERVADRAGERRQMQAKKCLPRCVSDRGHTLYNYNVIHSILKLGLSCSKGSEGSPAGPKCAKMR